MSCNPITDQIYQWRGFGDGFGKWESRCRLRIWQPHPEATIVMLSDEGLDTGTSITNCVEHLAPRIVQEFQLQPEATTWIEHYPGHRQESPEVEFSRVCLKWSGRSVFKVHWEPMTQQDTENLVAQAL